MNRKILALAPIIAASSIIRQSKNLKVRKTTLKFDKLPQNFDNFKIAQVSDVHCDRIGYSDLSFIKKIKDFNPDMIAIVHIRNIKFFHSIYKLLVFFRKP